MVVQKLLLGGTETVPCPYCSQAIGRGLKKMADHVFDECSKSRYRAKVTVRSRMSKEEFDKIFTVSYYEVI